MLLIWKSLLPYLQYLLPLLITNPISWGVGKWWERRKLRDDFKLNRLIEIRTWLNSDKFTAANYVNSNEFHDAVRLLPAEQRQSIAAITKQIGECWTTAQHNIESIHEVYYHDFLKDKDAVVAKLQAITNKNFESLAQPHLVALKMIILTAVAKREKEILGLPSKEKM